MYKKQKFIATFLIFSIISLSGNLFAKGRRGAELIIVKKDGQEIHGELIAVKESSLLLLERESGADEQVNIDDIKVIKIKKKSLNPIGQLVGFLIGGGIGAYWGRDSIRGAIIVGSLIGIAGMFIGAIIGEAVSVGYKEIIRIEGKSDSEKEKILEDLRSRARIPDFDR